MGGDMTMGRGHKADARADEVSLDLYPAPLLAVRDAAHAPAGLHPDHDRVAPVEAAAGRGVVEARLLGEAHVPAQHRTIAQGQVGRLVSFDAGPVCGTVVHVLLDTLRDLVLVDLV